MKALLGIFLLLTAFGLRAEDNVLLVQNGPQGFVVWHVEGNSLLPEDDILDIMATAQPEGGEVVKTPLGSAQAFALENGVLVRLPEAPNDRAWLIDRDACGHIKLWHAEGKTQLPEDMLRDLMLSALPDGGPRLRFGDRYGKAFLGRLGTTITLWQVPPSKK